MIHSKVASVASIQQINMNIITHNFITQCLNGFATQLHYPRLDGKYR